MAKEVNFEGRHLRVRGASTLIQAVQRPYPPLYFGGSSPAGIEIGLFPRLPLRHADPSKAETSPLQGEIVANDAAAASLAFASSKKTNQNHA